MTDEQIVSLCWERDEQAVSAMQQTYSAYCAVIAQNILHSDEDTQECLNDTWLRAWNAIPPQKPKRLAVFLGAITRNLALDRWRNQKSQKNAAGQTAACLDELAECVGTAETLEDTVALREALNAFLRTRQEPSKQIFLLRYWYLLSNREIASRCGISEDAVKMSLKRTREALRKHLETEGFSI